MALQIYEINTWVWLNTLTLTYGRPITLKNIPPAEINTLASLHINAVWLMGVWERSPQGRQIAQEHSGLQQDYRNTLPDYTANDVVGSPYSVHRYQVDAHLGGTEGLASFRQQLQQLGIKLILDFVPNHVAVDNPWVNEHPDYFITGQSNDLASNPSSFFQAGASIIAHGRDPYFPAWTDTAQLNAFSPSYRQATIETLKDIATQCDGIRCDMAMLLTNRIFSQTWQASQRGETPAIEYWQAVTQAIRAHYPTFLFIAEVYWDMEYELQQQGFDFCYDKRLYDRLLHNDISGVNQHLAADLSYQKQLIRFIENHDEQRAIKAFGANRSRAAAIIIATLPGATLWHKGQFYGYKLKLPVQLGRSPHEATDALLYRFYTQLLEEVQNPIYITGKWQLRQNDKAWPENHSNANMLAYTWQQDNQRHLIVINYSDHRSQSRIKLSDFGLEGITWKLTDILDNSTYERVGERMVEDGLYIDLQAWSAHLFHFSPMS